VTQPRTSESAERRASFTAGDARKQSQVLSVLIADDHDLFAASLAELLQYEADLDVVGRAADGAEAVALASRLRPDVVVMDVNMPGCDGIAATREITRLAEETRVVMLTAINDIDTSLRARAAGAAAYLIKGCSAAELVSAIRAATLAAAG
jgi:DNA-binding NarL/FixJ family response regulator